MGVERTVTGPGLPTALWDQRAMDQFAKANVDIMRDRAFTDGKGLDDADFAAYSKTPLAFHNAMVGPKPRGGRPIYHEPWMEKKIVGGFYRGSPFDLYRWTHDQTKPGRKSARSRQIVGRAYDGGYDEYKVAMRGTNRVTLNRTGALLRSLTVKSKTLVEAIIGMTGDAAVYGTFVNADRPFIGQSPKGREVAGIAFTAAWRGAADRSRKR